MSKTGAAGAVRHTIIYGLGTLLQKAVAFVMLPVYTRVLTPADYGTLALIDMTLDVITIAAGAQMAYALFRFYHKADTEAERHAVVSTVFLTLAASYGAVGLLTAAAADPLARLVFDGPENAGLIRLAAAGMVVQSLVLVPMSYLQVTDRSTGYVVAQMAKLVIQLSLNIILLVVVGMGIKGIMISTIVSNSAVGVVLAVWMLRKVGLGYSADAARGVLRYAVPMVGTQFATFLTTFGDRYFLNAFADEAAVGLYNLSYQFGFILFTIGFVPFGTMWGPKRFAIAKEADVEQRDRQLATGFTYGNVLIVVTAVGISLFVGDLLHLMTPPAFHASADVVPIILAAYVLLAWCNIQDLGILLKEKTEYLTLTNWIAAGVAISGWALLIPRYGAFGAAIAGALSFLVRYLLTLWYSQRLHYIRYEWSGNLRLVAIACGTVALSRLLPTMGWGWSVATHAVLFAAFVAVAWSFGPLDRPERERLVQATGLSRFVRT